MTQTNSLPSLRVGQGFDVHPWSSDQSSHLVLAGVSFAEHRGVVGHSDGDVIAHACTDAILGAAGIGDIGQMFPDSDPAFAGANSVELLRSAVEKVRAAGWRVMNVDCTVVLDQPRISSNREEMQANLSSAVDAPVSIKGKRTEGLGSLSDGPRCWATALLQQTSSSTDTPSVQADKDEVHQ